MKKPFHLLFTAAFMLACLLPAAGMLAFGPSPAAGNETPIHAPSLTNPDGSFNIEFLSDAADWFSQGFGFRRELITADSGLKAKLFGTSTQPLVALGQGEWLYYAETLDDYTGADTLTERQAYCIARSLRLAQDYAQQNGAEFVFTIAPNKASVYPEYLAGGLQPAGAEYAAPAVEAMEREGVAYADLFGPLRAQKETLDSLHSFGEPLYFTLDSHWTNRGAALGHDVLLDALGLPAEDAFGKTGSYQPTHRGDLHEMLYPASDMLDLEFTFDQPLSFEYARPIRDVDDLRIETTSGSRNGPLLMFRDSFGNALHSLMAESFSAARFSRAVPYNMEQIGELGAEYVVIEIVERNLPRLAEGSFLMPAPQVEEFPWNEPSTQDSGPWLSTAHIEAEASGQFIKVTAAVADSCDVDSPVYLLYISAGGQTMAWEAFPTYDGPGRTVGTAFFAADRLPEGTLHMMYHAGGQWRLALSDELARDAGWLEDMGILPTQEE